MALISQLVTVLTTKTVCPANSTSGASGRGVDIMAAASIAAAAAVFGAML